MNNAACAAARSFLESEGMLFESLDIDSLVKGFLLEMEAGLGGRPSSLAMLPTYYSTPLELPEGEDVAVIDAGGTNLRRGIMRPSEEHPEIRGFAERFMPGTRGEISRDEFLRDLADFTAPVLTPDRRIGFCFSYPAASSPDKDARVVSMTKELKIRGVIGTYIGRELLHLLRSDGRTVTERVAVLNDSIALFLSGWHHDRDRFARPGGPLNIGYILGTGANCCYQELNENIASVRAEISRGEQIINMESGGFEAIPRGGPDEDLDALTAGKDRYTLEKMTAGAYLGPLLYLTLRRGGDAGLFGKTAGEALREQGTLETRDLSLVLKGEQSSPLANLVGGGSDFETVRHIASLLLERAALVAAVPIAAVIERSISLHGKGSFSEVRVSAEGSTLFKVPGYKDRIQEYAAAHAGRNGACDVRIRNIAGGSLLGAGLAAVSKG